MEKFQTTGLIDAIVEVPMGSDPVKYEYDKVTGCLTVDRILSTSMHYPTNYGYIPNTLSGDGDPLDVLIVAPYPLQPNVSIECRPVGMLLMTDESGPDAKILVVPSDKITKEYSHIQIHQDFRPCVLDKISHFFQHYKDLESNKWVKVEGWKDIISAKDEIAGSFNNYCDIV